ncbi:MAG: anion permease, partial [Clostridia bacterium]|nr:anion permease [Clostridia bacterium]
MYSAITSLIIFGFCIILFVWDKLPQATSALLGCALMVIFGVCDFGTAFGQLAGSTVIMLIGVLVMGAAITESGIAHRLANAAIRLSSGSERIFIAALFILAFALSTFLTNVTVLAIFIPVVFAVSSQNSGINPLNAVIPLTLAVNMGGITTLVGSSQQMTAQGLLEEYGFESFKVFDFSPFGLMLGAVILIYILTIGYPLGKRIWGGREATEYVAVSKVPDGQSKRKTVTVCIIFAVSVFFYIYCRIPFTSIEIPPHVTSTVAALACIISGCITQKKAIESVNWNIVGRLGACLGLAKALSVSGGIALLSDGMLLLLGSDISPFALFAIITLLAQLASLFISNSTAISVALLLVISLAPDMALNIPAYAMGITLTASMGASCPLSGSTWG